MLPPLPIDPFLPQLRQALSERRAAVLTAEPGAGKSTRVPPALVDDGPVILLQPRRVAARSLARRIAEEQGWRVGGEVGWHIRFERRVSSETRLVVATEGILTARLQSDPLLSDFRTVILDEFHERSIHADLALALTRQAMEARDDLRLVVMSATLDAEPLCRFLDGAPHIAVPGRTHPVTTAYRPGAGAAEAVRELLQQTSGHVLVFMPGRREIDATIGALSDLRGVELFALHGSLPSEEQDRVLAPSSARKVIVATNIAETSLTIDGVSAVVDSGMHRILRYDAEHGIDRLVLERITADSATQRAGRAGRTAPGRAIRLWDERQLLTPHREPEIHRVDLAPVALELLQWGGDPRTFDWFEAPSPAAVDAAMSLLRLLGGTDERGRLTELGTRLHRFSLHPRVARFLLSTSGSRRAALAAALLEEGTITAASARGTAESDLLLALDRTTSPSPQLREAISAIDRDLQNASRRSASDDDDTLLRAVFDAFPDRVARRRAPGSDLFLLASGTGARLSRDSSVRTAEWLVALDLGSVHDGALIRAASAVDPAWLAPTSRHKVHRIDDEGRVRAFDRLAFGEIVIRESAVAADPEEAARLITSRILAMIDEGAVGADLVGRLRFAGVEVDWPAIAALASAGKKSLHDVDLAAHLPGELRRRLDKDAPLSIGVPSGRRAALEYRDDGTVEMAVKLQELFGLASTPRIGPNATPVTILLLAPNGRPVQTTRDLASFWSRTYPEVRKELRGRYPKHPWPDDPMTAPATARTKKRS